MKTLALICFSLTTAVALDNGLARTPPMGWLAWERFRCNTDCVNDPDNCISEHLFMTMADIVAEQGYLAVGYNHINVDECWTARTRDSEGRLQPDISRFPHGMHALGRYIHSRGLKYGVYTDYGTHTCNGQYPGSKDFLQLDAQTFAAWEADYLKLDGCYDDPRDWVRFGIPDMAFWLNRTGRPIVLSTEFPLYISDSGYPRIPTKNGTEVAGAVPNYKAVSKVCHVARNHADIQDSWDSVVSIINFYATNLGEFASVAGPGFWNDPDMLIIGNFGLSYEQQKVQMAMWCLWSAPLLMSVDLRSIEPESRALLLNASAIAVNQDPLGVQGTFMKNVTKNIQLWTKQLAEQSPAGAHTYAFTVINLGVDGTPKAVSLTPADLKLTGQNGYRITEVFNGDFVGKVLLNGTFTVHVNPSGVFFGRATPL